MNNPLPCGKLVNNLVEKSVKNSWNKIVEFAELGISWQTITHSLLKFSTFARKCVNKLNKFCTEEFVNFNLLYRSFPLFPQTSTITITNLNK